MGAENSKRNSLYDSVDKEAEDVSTQAKDGSIQAKHPANQKFEFQKKGIPATITMADPQKNLKINQIMRNIANQNIINSSYQQTDTARGKRMQADPYIEALASMMKGNDNYTMHLIDNNNESYIFDKKIQAYVHAEVIQNAQDLASNRKERPYFVDLEFIPSDESIVPNRSQSDHYVWRHLDDIIQEDHPVVTEELNPCDVMQGVIADCYFLSALCILTQTRQGLTNIFHHSSDDAFKIYSFWLNDSGEWRIISVDDLIPCWDSRRGPISANGKNDELWVLLLEKAYAKMFGSYKAIEFGYSAHALRDLTGVPYDVFDCKDNDDCWNYLRNVLNNSDWLVTVNTKANQKSLLTQRKNSNTERRTISQYCYAVVQVKEVRDRAGKIIRVIKLYNPWKYEAKFRDWAPDTDGWPIDMQNLLAQREPVLREGEFWISMNQFAKQFTTGACFKFFEGYTYSSLKLWCENGERESVIIMHIDKLFHGFIGINQMDDRHFSEVRNPTTGKRVIYDYNDIRAFVVKMDTKQQLVELKGNANSRDRDTFIEVELEPGLYALYFEIDWRQQVYKDFVITIYGSHNPILNEALIEGEKGKFQESLLKLFLMSEEHDQNENHITYEHLGEPKIERMIRAANGYLVFYYKNNSDHYSLREKVHMSTSSKLQIQRPYKNNEEFEVEVAPGKEVFVRYKILQADSFQYQYQFWSHLFIFYEDPDKMKEFVTQNATKVVQKSLKGNLMPVWMYSFNQPSMINFIWINDSEFAYDEVITFKLTNLILSSGVEKNEFQINLRPHSSCLLTLKAKELTQGISFTYAVSYKFRKYVPSSQIKQEQEIPSQKLEQSRQNKGYNQPKKQQTVKQEQRNLSPQNGAFQQQPQKSYRGHFQIPDQSQKFKTNSSILTNDFSKQQRQAQRLPPIKGSETNQRPEKPNNAYGLDFLVKSKAEQSEGYPKSTYISKIERKIVGQLPTEDKMNKMDSERLSREAQVGVRNYQNQPSKKFSLLSPP